MEVPEVDVPEVNVPEVDVHELEIALIQGGVLIDVREAEEFEAVRVPCARLIPLAEVAGRRGEIPNGSRVYVICAKGGRSRVAAELLREGGTDAVNVVGGTTAWLEAGKTVDSGDPV